MGSFFFCEPPLGYSDCHEAASIVYFGIRLLGSPPRASAYPACLVRGSASPELLLSFYTMDSEFCHGDDMMVRIVGPIGEGVSCEDLQPGLPDGYTLALCEFQSEDGKVSHEIRIYDESLFKRRKEVLCSPPTRKN